MAVFSGFISRAGEILRERDREAREESARRDIQELSLFQALAQSGDPDLAAMGATGMLSIGADRRPKGARRLLGELEANPVLGRIRELIQAGRPVMADRPDVAAGTRAGLPNAYFGQTPRRMNVEGAVLQGALPEGGVVEPGMPPPDLGTMPSRRVEVGREPRRVFPAAETTEQQAFGQMTGRARAIVEAMQRYGGDPRMARILEGISGSPVSEPRWAEGEIVEDPQSETGYSQIVYNTQDPTQTQRIPSGPPRTGAPVRTTVVQDRASPTGWSEVWTDPVSKQEVYRVPGVRPSYPPAETPAYYDEEGRPVFPGRGPGASPRLDPNAPLRAPTGARDDEVARRAQAMLATATTAARLPGMSGMDPQRFQRALQEEIKKALAEGFREFEGVDETDVRSLALRKGGPSGTPPPQAPGQGAPLPSSGIDPTAVFQFIDEMRRRRGGG